MTCLMIIFLLTGCLPFSYSNLNREETLVLTENAEPPNLDSATSTDQPSFSVLNNVKEGLMRLDASQKPVPAMAKEMPKISQDQKTYLFQLRDAYWSDGKPVTAYDFVFAWKRALTPETKSQYAFIFEPISNAMEYYSGKVPWEKVGIQALDAHTLKIQLKSPTPYFLHLLTFITYLPQRKDVVEKYGDQYAKEAHTQVYNGPFQLIRWNHNENLVLVKNQKYWDQQTVQLKQVDLKIVKEVSTTINLYLSGDVDFVEVNQYYAKAFEHSPQRFVIQEAGIWYLEMNQQEKFLRNPNIRKALYLAIDRQTLTQKILNDGSQPAGKLVPPAIQSFRKFAPDDPPSYQPGQAKQFWKKGLQELGIAKLEPLELVGDDSETSKTIMVYLKEQFRKNFGIEIKISSVPFKQRLQRGKNGQFQLLLSSWLADYNDPLTFLNLFITNGSYNRGKWSHTTYDQYVQQGIVQLDENKRRQAFIEAEKILIREAGIIPLYYSASIGITKPYIRNIIFHPIGPQYSLKWAQLINKPKKR